MTYNHNNIVLVWIKKTRSCYHVFILKKFPFLYSSFYFCESKKLFI
jgi:hypothetical protein